MSCKHFGQISQELRELSDYLTPLKEYICTTATKGDVFLIQCYFGGCYEMINYVKSLGFNAFYSTTKRNVVEKEIDSKIVKTSVFEHIIFRKF